MKGNFQNLFALKSNIHREHFELLLLVSFMYPICQSQKYKPKMFNFFIHILISTEKEYILTYKIVYYKSNSRYQCAITEEMKLFLLIVALTSKDVGLWLLLCSSAFQRLGSIRGALSCWITMIVGAESSNLSPVWPSAYLCWTEASRLGSQQQVEIPRVTLGIAPDFSKAQRNWLISQMFYKVLRYHILKMILMGIKI